jgi:CDP-glycerol glycerophosphotransferase (TagB/SpsB family)
VSSEKERDVIVRDLHYDPKRVLITGLTQFSLLEYQHIADDADDIVTIMLTWKPYDEILSDPSTSAYYQNLLQTVEVVSDYVPQQNLRVIAHPKTAQMLAETSLGASLWQGPINEALQSTKLLITDYSSVCYNVFYQGGAVIFYQPDLERYEQEVGPLIPSDDEYLGIRTFSVAELRPALARAIGQEGRVALASMRTAHYERNNDAINPYHDGKNIDRVFQALKETDIIAE